jgi:hypothetical protein
MTQITLVQDHVKYRKISFKRRRKWNDVKKLAVSRA